MRHDAVTEHSPVIVGPVSPLVNNNINSIIRLMKPVKQEDGLGCAVACVAFILGTTYKDALMLFKDGQARVKNKANFYCPEIVQILKTAGRNYAWEKLYKNNLGLVENDYSIVFIKKSKSHPYGHFLVRFNGTWMDPWINLPNEDIRAGFRDELPGEPTYLIYKV